MATRDLTGDVSLAPSAVPAARTNGTVNGTGVDTSGYDAVSCYVNAGVWTDGTHAVKVQDSDDNSSFADVAAGNLIGTLVSITSAPTASKNLEQGVINNRRYVRLVITTSGATTGALVGGGFLLGKPGMAPVA